MYNAHRSGYPRCVSDGKAAGIRERNRNDITEAILGSARRQLVADGAGALSLRAVARDLGMASSAIYRYFPSRDALLTQLIIDAYNSLGDEVERAHATVDRNDLGARFGAIGRAVRGWALAHEHEYALIYGSPVPGYAAPQDTVGPASRVSAQLLQILVDGLAAGVIGGLPPVGPGEQAAIAPIRQFMADQGADIPDELMVRALAAWTLLFGAVSFELFGHLHNVVADEREADNRFFDGVLDRLALSLGLV